MASWAPDRTADGPKVTLLVGKDKTPIAVRRDKICNASASFKAAFMSDSNEISEGTMRLPGEDVDVVKAFIEWLNTQTCSTLTVPEYIIADGGNYFMKPFQLLVFAEKYGIPDLKTPIFKKLLSHGHDKRHRMSPSTKVIDFVYSNTPRSSGIRKLLADWYAACIDKDWFSISANQEWLLTITEFSLDLVLSMAQVSPEEDHQYPIQANDPWSYTEIPENGGKPKR